jgi:hypothetical protein
MSKKLIFIIATSAIMGCLIINCLIVGSYQFYVAYNDWIAKDVKIATAKDFGYQPQELAMDMEFDTLKAMEKAIKEELKYREKK